MRRNNGFTLIEILLGLTIIMIMIGVSVIGFTQFNKQQALNSAYDNLKNGISEAKSDALSQVIIKCTSLETLVGYQIRFVSSNSYSIEEVCLGASEIAKNIKTISLPQGLRISASTSHMRFLVLTGKLDNGGFDGIISLTNGAQTKTININSQGVIESEESH